MGLPCLVSRGGPKGYTVQSSIDYQDNPFEKLRELTAHLTDIFRPDPEPIDWLDELEAERLEAKAERMRNENPTH